MTATPQPLLWWTAILLAVVAIDVTAYLAAAGRAQGAADAAALAAVVAQDVATPTPARTAADGVAAANGGRLEDCRCRHGTGRAVVVVSVEVPGLVVPRLVGAGRVTASAEAQLTRPAAHPVRSERTR